MSESSVLVPFKEMIEREYARLVRKLGPDFLLGWGFLYTPAWTLARGTSLVFVPINPAVGMHHDRPHLEYEKGSAYRTEHWARGENHSALQKQIRCLYDELAKRDQATTDSTPVQPPAPPRNAAGLTRAEELMDKTLALNFCPFRTQQRWSRLDRESKDELIAFSQSMWTSVLEIVEPSVIVCLGNDPMKYLHPVLQDRATTWNDLREHPTGWANATWGVRCYTSPSGRMTTMVRIPHLSTFKIFSRRECEPAIGDIADNISAALRREQPEP